MHKAGENIRTQTTTVEEVPHNPEWVDKTGRPLGYGPDPDCSVCRGLGWFVLDVGYDHPQFGKAFPCAAAGCLDESRRAYKAGHDPTRIHRAKKQPQTFDTFKSLTGTVEAIKEAKLLASGQAKYCWLLIYGGRGNGKSHLCNATTTALAERGCDARMYDVADLMAKCRRAISTHTLEDEIQALKETEALILDDWRTEYASDWEASRLTEVLDYRYREYLLTVLTTNSSPNELPERLWSRFADKGMSKAVVNKGVDVRRKGQ